VLNVIVKNVSATLPAVCHKKVWPKKTCDMLFVIFYAGIAFCVVRCHDKCK
jgi:hypothetical protein